jgi:hypothetical protein
LIHAGSESFDAVALGIKLNVILMELDIEIIEILCDIQVQNLPDNCNPSVIFTTTMFKI